MCGIVGIVAKSSVNRCIYDALTVLQHRGQDAAGIVTCDDGLLHLRKANGLVRDAISPENLISLVGHYGIGHVRYPTAGTSGEAEAQPFYVNFPYGISLAHNGNLTNTEQLQQALRQTALRHLNTSSDSEVILNVFADELQKFNRSQLTADDIFAAVANVHQRCRGAYAVVVLIAGYGIVGFRDPNGIRPICLGQRQGEQGVEYMLSSESAALEVSDFEHQRDLLPGEAIYITETGQIFAQQCAEHVRLAPCLFEYVYLARADSVIDKILVYKVRLKLGEFLAEKLLRENPSHNIDVVMPVPETSKTAAYSMALKLGLKYREGFVKNHYIGRTFIMPGQKLRKKSVRQKLNTINLEFQDKNVLLVDDSIVRGTTSQEIIQMARDAGAKKVYFASAAPEVRYPNVYGIDMPCANELIAYGRDCQAICRAIGADWLIFQELQALIDAAREGNHEIVCFEDSVFSGHYLTGDIDDAYLMHLEKKRNDAAKAKHQQQDMMRQLGLHNYHE